MARILHQYQSLIDNIDIIVKNTNTIRGMYDKHAASPGCSENKIHKMPDITLPVRGIAFQICGAIGNLVVAVETLGACTTFFFSYGTFNWVLPLWLINGADVLDR